jgi:cell division protein FtsW (lipid II flippase)
MPQPVPTENSSYLAVLLSAGLLIPFAAAGAVARRSGESWSHHHFIWDMLFWMVCCGTLAVIVGGYLDLRPRWRHKSQVVFWLWASIILVFLILSAQPQYARE